MRNHILGQRDSSEMTKEFAIVISQFTLPWRERQKTKRFSSSSLNFNPRPREGSDNQQDWLKPEMPYFNPRPREGSDVFLQSVVVVLQISIHAPVKGATATKNRALNVMCYFNSRPREGSDVPVPIVIWSPLISIHAPVKGATAPISAAFFSTTISIHAPVKGTT